MNSSKKEAVLKALKYWAVSFAVVAGYLYYHSSAPLGPILIAGLVTLLALGLTAYLKSENS